MSAGADSVGGFLFPPVGPSSVVHLLVDKAREFGPMRADERPAVAAVIFLCLPDGEDGLFATSLLSVFFLHRCSCGAVYGFLSGVLVCFAVACFRCGCVFVLGFHWVCVVCVFGSCRGVCVAGG